MFFCRSPCGNYIFIMNLIILDYTTSHVSIIELTEEENQKSEEFENFEDFMVTIEEKYGFKTENCQWIISEELFVDYYRQGVLSDAF